MYAQSMTAVPEPLMRLAQHVERRITELALEYAEVCRLAGISDQTLIGIRKGLKSRGTTYRKLEGALQWEQGSIAAILAGGEPTPAVKTESGDTDATVTQLSSNGERVRRVVQAMAREWGLKPQEMDEVLRLVRQDLQRVEPDEDEAEDPGDSRVG